MGELEGGGVSDWHGSRKKVKSSLQMSFGGSLCFCVFTQSPAGSVHVRSERAHSSVRRGAPLSLEPHANREAFFGAVNRAGRFERLPGPARAWARAGNWPCWGKRSTKRRRGRRRSKKKKARSEALAPPVDAVWKSRQWKGRDSGLMYDNVLTMRLKNS